MRNQDFRVFEVCVLFRAFGVEGSVLASFLWFGGWGGGVRFTPFDSNSPFQGNAEGPHTPRNPL